MHRQDEKAVSQNTQTLESIKKKEEKVRKSRTKEAKKHQPEK